MKALTVTTTCLGPCGELGTGLSTDPPQGRRRAGWTRWDELDHLAEKHPHPTRISAEPAEETR